jgi:hypothetical protein
MIFYEISKRNTVGKDSIQRAKGLSYKYILDLQDVAELKKEVPRSKKLIFDKTQLYKKQLIKN